MTVRRSQLVWYALQIGIVGGFTWLYGSQINPSAAAPTPGYVGPIIGVGLALLVTTMLSMTITWFRTASRRDMVFWGLFELIVIGGLTVYAAMTYIGPNLWAAPLIAAIPSFVVFWLVGAGGIFRRSPDSKR